MPEQAEGQVNDSTEETVGEDKVSQAEEQSIDLNELRGQVSEFEERARNAEKLLTKAKQELLDLTTSSSKEPLEKRLEEVSEQNTHLSRALQVLQKQLEERQKDASHWRGRFLLSEIDVVAASGRAEQAEKKLSEAVKPVPYDQERLILERDLSWMAFVDPITGLGNGNRLDLEMKKSLSATLQAGKLMALFVIDIDKFRELNNFAGWEAGNNVLKRLADQFQTHIPKTSLMVRRAEDEFCMLEVMDGPGQGEMGESPLVRLRQIADFLLSLIATPQEVNYQKYPLTASIGISIAPDDADNESELLENAYSALATAKRAGGGRYQIFSQNVYQEKESRANLAAEMRGTLEGDGLLFLYRPIVNVAQGNLAAAVLEPYWQHPSHGRIAQDDFMPLAEDYGLVGACVKQMIEAACELSRKMKGSVPVVISCPASVLKISEFGKHFMDAINRARVDPRSFVLELPAEALLNSKPEVVKLFTELSRWGLGSSLLVSDNTAINWTSLPESFVSLLHTKAEVMDSVPAQETRRSVVQGYLDMTKRLAVPMLVSGVTDASQGHFLALHGCAWAAGDFLATPLDVKDFVSRRRATWRLK